MIKTVLDMKYVIGFPIKDERVLLIKRNKHPWINRWNGAGGKLEQGETAFEAINREMLEETGIDLDLATENRFVGIVSWDDNKNSVNNTAMFAFISYLSEEQTLWEEEKTTKEGILAWKPLEWACSKDTKEIADNIPYFLPLMIQAKHPQRYHCVFRDSKLIEVKVQAIPEGILPNTTADTL